MSQPLSVEPGASISLADFDACDTSAQPDKGRAKKETADNVAVLGELAYRLYAENRRALLVVLQGMDTSGKDGTIRKVMQAVSPQSCQVTPFREPSAEELDHDFLWRIHKAVPRRGNIGIFNRSHYEDVLIVRVRNLVPREEWATRYEKINTFEHLLATSHITLVKIFLHISNDEQRKRLEKRLRDPKRNWKFSQRDLEERKLWDEYQRAYEDALTRCNTHHAPWHIVPANHKWYRNLLVSRLLRETLQRLDPQYPPPEEGIENLVVE